MREHRVPVEEVLRGEYVVKVGDREIGKAVFAVVPVQPGQRLRGPRGGGYVVRLAGAYVKLETGTGHDPIVRTGSTAVVLRDTEEN